MSDKYLYDEEKNLKLKRERGIGFEEVIAAIDEDRVLDIIPHHHQKLYPHQKILVLEINHYVYLAPYVEKGDLLVLKTVFPSSKFTKKYLGGSVK